MTDSPLEILMRLTCALLGLPLLAAPPTFTVREAIQAEWNRQPPIFSEKEKAQLSPAEITRLELTLKRIGFPGSAPLLPPELDKPSREMWEAKAAEAKSPQERFTALFFLNRFKSAKALLAMEGLGGKDAGTWPRHLHLEAQIATARLNGGEVNRELQSFLNGLQKLGKIDPVRAQAAQLRLVMGGKAKELLPPVKATPGSVLALMDALKASPASTRAALTKKLWLTSKPSMDLLGLQDPTATETKATLQQIESNFLARMADIIPPDMTPQEAEHFIEIPLLMAASGIAPFQASAIESAKGFPKKEMAFFFQESPFNQMPPILQGTALGPLRTIKPGDANALRNKLLSGSDPVARAAAIDDMTEAPGDLDALISRLWKTEEYDGVQVLIQALEKWKLPEDRRKAILSKFADHPCWTARLDAWRELSKLDPKTLWPVAPKPSATDEAIIQEAERLAMAGKPVRMRLHFAGKRQVTLHLDPRNAPMNVANLVILARKGFFNGRLIPRVVPDFVVQMGSPCDTMDGGPGYTVRCENSTTWYGPGSVGMALSGKDTGGSQFFITTNAAPHLTGKYTRVGEVEELDSAMKILDDLELGAKLEQVEVLGE